MQFKETFQVIEIAKDSGSKNIQAIEMALKQSYIFSKSVILVTKNSHFNIKIRMLKQYAIRKRHENLIAL